MFLIQEEQMNYFRKFIFLWVLFFCFALSVFSVDENIVKIEASVSPQRLARGQEGKLVLKLTLQEGISISPQPSFIIEISPGEEISFSKNVYTANDLGIKISKENGEEYLDLKEPLEMLFQVRLEAKQGNHRLEGKIKYFACSKEEKWCLKNSTKFSAAYYTRNTTFKKKKGSNPI